MPLFPAGEPRTRTVYVVRHGRTTANEQHVFQGWGPYELSTGGLADLKAAGAWWDGRELGWVIASPLRRTLQTARELFGRVDEIDPGWVEVALVGMEGRSTVEIAEEHPDLLLPAGWQRPGAPAHPAFENMASTQHRAISSLRHASSAPGARPVVVVTHGALLVALLRADGAEVLDVPNLCVLEIEVDGPGWRMVAVHDPLILEPETSEVVDVQSERCACCNEPAPLRENDPFDGRMDAYCDECAWRRCDVYWGACSFEDPLA